MEYALGGEDSELYSAETGVLILVVMEYALGGDAHPGISWVSDSLNPCCDGICSRRHR